MVPPARRSDHVDLYFGTAVPDPYRWMEEVDSAEVATWVTAQNALTQSVLDQVAGRDALLSRLRALTDFERFSAPMVRNGRYVYAHNTGLQNQAVLLSQEGLDGEPEVLLDPNTLSADGTIALAGLSLSDDGTKLAYALAEAGSDWITWHVRELGSRRDLEDHVTRSKFSGASWLPDGSGFFYSGYGMPSVTVATGDALEIDDGSTTQVGSTGSATTADLKDMQHFHTVFFHRLGAPQASDVVVYERRDDGELLLSGQVTDDSRYLLLTASKGHTNELWALRLGTDGRGTIQIPTAASAANLISIAPAADARYEPVDTDGDTLWVQTTAEAPNGRVVAIDLTQADRAGWQTVLPEDASTLDSVSMVADMLIATYLADAQSRVRLRSRTGESLGDLKLPGIGTVTGFSGRRLDRESFVTFTNFVTPPTVLRLDLLTRQLAPYRAPKLNFDPAAFETRQIFFASKDGTRVPMFVTARCGLVLDGSHPALLYAYGGFGVSLLPAFSPAHLLWMEMGGIFAQPSLRGGGEYGESWHDDGTRLKKQNVFDDFIAAAESLIAQGYTRPERLAIEGGSNGGLLVGAVELQRPELFGAVLAHVGVFDMLRFDQFTIGYAWKSDYGSPSESEPEFRALLRYSPLHNVRSGVSYPPTLVLTADHDDRVFPAHSFKFVAAMQHALASERISGNSSAQQVDRLDNGSSDSGLDFTDPARPTLIRVETRAGHGAGMPLSKRLEQTVDTYLFLVRYLGIEGCLALIAATGNA